MRAAGEAARHAGRRIGLVPTMGFLHEGHLSLVWHVRERCDTVVMSIFVNPTQFSPEEDLEKYPRDLPRDAALAAAAGVDTLFVPEVADMYPDTFDTYITPGAAGAILEGAVRPHHFRGVLTVVAKLFQIVSPHVAVFGQKDFQQALLIRRMVHDLDFDVEVLVSPIVREPDGVAMSSRNVYLSTAERVQAVSLSQALRLAEALIAAGEHSAAVLIGAMTERISREPDARIEYVSVANANTLQPQEHLTKGTPTVIALAVRVGNTRLLDNVVVTP